MMFAMDPATEYVIAGGLITIAMAIIATIQTVLMYYLSKWKEQRQDERADEIERKADERAERLAKAHKEEAGKVAEEVKAVKTALVDNPPVTSDAIEKRIKPLTDSMNKIEEQTNGMSERLARLSLEAGFQAGIQSEKEREASRKVDETPKSNKGE